MHNNECEQDFPIGLAIVALVILMAVTGCIKRENGVPAGEGCEEVRYAETTHTPAIGAGYNAKGEALTIVNYESTPLKTGWLCRDEPKGARR